MAEYTIRLNLGGDLIANLSRGSKLLYRMEAQATRLNARLSKLGIFGAAGGAAAAGAVGGARMGGIGMRDVAYGMPVLDRYFRMKGYGSVLSARYGGGTSGRREMENRYQHLSSGHIDYLTRIHPRLQRIGSTLTKNQLLGNFNTAAKSNKLFRDQFVRNMFTPSGWMRNAGNFVGAVFDSLAAVVKSHPALMATAVAGGIAAMKWAAPIVGGGLLYKLGSSVMNSQSMTKAISDRTQLEMAQKGLGDQYEKAIAAVTENAQRYGYSRAGMISLVNTLTGLEAGGKPIDVDQAVGIARITGKVSQIGGRPYDIVGLNMQQIFAATKPDMRDIRELLHAAPILSRYAVEDIKKSGQSGIDPRKWLQDREHLMKASYRLDRDFKVPNVSAARGRVELAKENFWIEVSRADRLWDTIGNAGVALFQRLQTAFMDWYKDFDEKSLMDSFNAFTDAMGSLAKNILNFAGWFGETMERLGYVGKWNGVNDYIDTVNARRYQRDKEYAVESAAKGTVDKNIDLLLKDPRVVKEFNLDAKDKDEREFNRRTAIDFLTPVVNRVNKENTIVSDQPISATGTPYKNTIAQPSIFSSKSYADYLNESSQYADRYKEVAVPTKIKASWIRTESDVERGITGTNFRNPLPDLVPTPTIDYNATRRFHTLNTATTDQILDAVGTAIQSRKNEFGGTSGGGADTHTIEDLTKGSKSLYINFNAALVNMPTTIYEAEDSKAMIQEIDEKIQSSASRAVHIAILNATQML